MYSLLLFWGVHVRNYSYSYAIDKTFFLIFEQVILDATASKNTCLRQYSPVWSRSWPSTFDLENLSSSAHSSNMRNTCAKFYLFIYLLLNSYA